MRPAHWQLTARWLLFAIWVVGFDAAAIHWTIAARKFIPKGGIGSGEGLSISYRGYDGSQVYVFQSYVTGKTTVHWFHPPTRMGLCYVWWPSLAGGLTTLLALALAATRNGRRLIVEFPLPRMTTRRWMIAVAVIGIEAGLIIGATRILGVDPRLESVPQGRLSGAGWMKPTNGSPGIRRVSPTRQEAVRPFRDRLLSRWPPILIYLAALPTLAFLPAFGRTRSEGAEMDSFGTNSES